MKVRFEGLECYSDAFLPFDDCLHALKEVGIKKLIQPGGSKSDSKIIQTAKDLGIEMVFTEVRHFWH